MCQAENTPICQHFCTLRDQEKNQSDVDSAAVISWIYDRRVTEVWRHTEVSFYIYNRPLTGINVVAGFSAYNMCIQFWYLLF